MRPVKAGRFLLAQPIWRKPGRGGGERYTKTHVARRDHLETAEG